MKALLISLGAIGRRHLTNLRGLERAADITVLRRPESAREGIPEAADRVVYSLEDALRMRPDVALIASPAPQHIEMALKLASEGIHLFIEKPLSSDLSGVDALISESRRQGWSVLAGLAPRCGLQEERKRERDLGWGRCAGTESRDRLCSVACWGFPLGERALGLHRRFGIGRGRLCRADI